MWFLNLATRTLGDVVATAKTTIAVSLPIVVSSNTADELTDPKL